MIPQLKYNYHHYAILMQEEYSEYQKLHLTRNGDVREFLADMHEIFFGRGAETRNEEGLSCF